MPTLCSQGFWGHPCEFNPKLHQRAGSRANSFVPCKAKAGVAAGIAKMLSLKKERRDYFEDFDE